MTRPRLALAGVSKSERHGVVAGVSDAISAAGGWIVDHTQFSNIAIALRFALPPGGLDELRRRIAAAGVRLDAASLASLQAMAGTPATGGEGVGEEIAASINITFLHGEPDLRQVVPAVPG